MFGTEPQFAPVAVYRGVLVDPVRVAQHTVYEYNPVTLRTLEIVQLVVAAYFAFIHRAVRDTEEFLVFIDAIGAKPCVASLTTFSILIVA